MKSPGEYHWQELGRIDWIAMRNKLDAIECGEDFYQMWTHGWYHGVVPKTCNLGMQTWLGNRPLDPISRPGRLRDRRKEIQGDRLGRVINYTRGHQSSRHWVASSSQEKNRVLNCPSLDRLRRLTNTQQRHASIPDARNAQ